MNISNWYAAQPALLKGLAICTLGLVALDAGASAASAAAPLVGTLLSAAGFGVAGGTLHGAAASSAGLAWLGGGSLASGGTGVAGGTAMVTHIGGASGMVLGLGAAAAVGDTLNKNSEA